MGPLARERFVRVSAGRVERRPQPSSKEINEEQREDRSSGVRRCCTRPCRVQRQHRLERQVLERRVRFREVPRGEVRRVPVLHQQVRQGEARRAGQRQVEWI